MGRAFIGCLYDTYIFYKIMDNTRNLFCTNEVIQIWETNQKVICLL